MTDLPAKSKEDDFYKGKARELLAELDTIGGPGSELSDWNIRAQTLILFWRMKEIRLDEE